MTTPFSVEAALDAFVVRTASIRPPDGKWHPSSITGCERKALYEVRGTAPTDERDSKSHRILRVGSELHRIIQQAVSEHPSLLAVHHEVNCEWPERNIAGSTDSLAQISEDTYEVEEYKSISENGFRYLKGSPKPEHADQARIYGYVLRHHGGWIEGGYMAEGVRKHSHMRYEGPYCLCGALSIPPLGDKLERARVVYVGKTALDIEEFTVPFTDHWEDKFEQKLVRLNKYRESGALPPRVPLDKGKPPKFPCGYCDFRTKCWDQDGEGVQL